MAFDPDNPTFYGTCLAVDQAHSLNPGQVGVLPSGASDIAGAIRYLYNDTSVMWMDSGAGCLVGFYPERGLLTLDDDVEFFLVVEVRSDSTGSVRLSAGVDPSWDLTDPGLASESLGTFDATGTQQIVVPVSSWLGSMIYAGDALPMIHVEALSGQPRIQQIRVRMWPVGGVSGAWEDDPDYELTDLVPRVAISEGSADMSSEPPVDQVLGGSGPVSHNPGPGTWGGFDDTGDTEAAFTLMQTWLIGHGIPSYRAFRGSGDGTLTGSYSYNWTLRSTGDPSHDWSGRFTSAMALLLADPVVAVTRQSGLSWPDPDRVPNEAAAAVRDGFTGGTLRSTFQAWTALPEVSEAVNANDQLVSVGTYALTGEPAWAATGLDTSSGFAIRTYLAGGGLEHTAFSYPLAGPGLVALPNTPVVALEVNGSQPGAGSLDMYQFEHALGIGDQALGSRSVNYAPVRSRQRYQNVQWYNPGGVAKSKPRFFVKHRDDTMRPVGFGKPATELTLFRVPGRGRWRDLTTAEYATFGPTNRPPGGMPLKVKRLDAGGTVWWDHVGWLVPDPE